MKTIKAKRMAAVAAGAALLGLGIAFAGPLTFQSVPIISNSGQPLVQVVVGHAAKPSDGVAAANIAAAIGNLAFASVPVTATINTTQASKVLHVAVSGVSSGTGIVPNAQVYFNTSGVSFAAGTYGFSTLIGSVMNRAIKTSQFASTKSIGSTSADGYATGSNTFSTSSVSSPYTDSGYLPVSTVTASTNGGGVSFTTLTNGGFDNILRVTNSNLPSLLSNAGSYGESEYIWLTGFPVFDQQSSVNNFALLSAGGAYQVTFNKPINYKTSSNTINNAAFTLLGENWTIISANIPTVGTVGSNLATSGGTLELASGLTPMSTVYVGQNLTSGKFTVELADLGQPNANGVSTAALNVYYNGALTNTTAVSPGTITPFNVSGTSLYVNVNQTFAGLYAYEKYAKMKLYSNVFNVTSGDQFNKTSNPDWYTVLEWTNSSGSGIPNALYSIILYNSQTQTLTPGQSMSFITSPAAYKLTFVGETQGSANFDPISITSTSVPAFSYANQGNTVTGINTTAVTEPAQELVVTSQIPNAFTTLTGQQTSSLTYDLTTYEYTAATNDVVSNSLYSSSTNTLVGTFTSSTGAPYVNANVPLTVTVKGYTVQGQQITKSLVFNGLQSNSTSLSTPFKNVTNVQFSRAIPLGANSLTISEEFISGNTVANSVDLGTLSPTTPKIVYTKSGQNYDAIAGSHSVTYNQQNGQASQTFSLASASTPTGNLNEYYSYTMGELPATPYSTVLTDSLSFGIYNSTAGVGASPLFQLNYSASGTKNNMTYESSQNQFIQVPVGFRTEKGSKVASITPTALTVDMAKAVDTLAFAVSTSGGNSSTVTHATVGPFGIGQSLTSLGLPNASVSKVTGTLALGPNATYSITGISNITATPSVSQAISPVLLKNLTTAPIAVLDNASTLNPASSLVLIGSGYVNSLSEQVQTANNFTASPSMGNGSGYIVQAFSGSNGSGARIYVAGYSAADTTAAANAFIQDLYNNAASGS